MLGNILRLARILTAPTALALISGCVDVKQYQEQPFQRSFQVAGNYQAVYAQTLDTMRYCLASGFNPLPINDFAVDGQLFNELGYGIIDHTIKGGLTTPVMSVRVERDGEDTKVSMKTPANHPDRNLDRAERLIQGWANGGRECQ